MDCKTITNDNLELFIMNTYALYTRGLEAAKTGKGRGYWYGFIISAVTRYRAEIDQHADYSDCYDMEKAARWAKTEFEQVASEQ